MIIGEGCLNGATNDLEISGFPNLETIFVNAGSLQNLKSLKISNNEKLETFKVGSAFEWGGAFNRVEEVVFESIVNHFLYM